MGRKPLQALYFLQYAPRALMSAIISANVVDSRPFSCYTNGFITGCCKIGIGPHLLSAKALFLDVRAPLAQMDICPTSAVEFAPRRRKKICGSLDYGYTNEEMLNYALGAESQAWTVDPGRDRFEYSRFYSGVSCGRPVSKRVLRKYQISTNSNIFQSYSLGVHSISGLQVKQLGLGFREEDSADAVNCKRPETFSRLRSVSCLNEEEVNPLDISYFLQHPSHFFAVELPFAEFSSELLVQMRFLFQLVLDTKQTEFLQLDDDFNLTQKYELTTKEIKKSRIGHALGLILELCQLLKGIRDIAIARHSTDITAVQAEGILLYLLQNVGHRVAIYRFKYKTMKHFRAIRAMAELNIEDCYPYLFALNEVFRSLGAIMEQYIRSHIMRLLGNPRIERLTVVTKERRERSIDMYYSQASGELGEYFSEAWALKRTSFTKYYSSKLSEVQLRTLNDLVEQRWEHFRLECLEVRKRIYFSRKAFKSLVIKDNFNKYSILLMSRLEEHDNELLAGLRKEEVQLKYQKWFAKAQELALPEISSDELLDSEVKSLALEMAQRLYSLRSRSESEGELLKLAETDFSSFFANIISIYKNYTAGRINIQFYDYLQYVDVRFDDELVLEILDRLVISLIVGRITELLDLSISLSSDASHSQFIRTKRELSENLGNKIIETTSEDYGIIYDISIRFLNRVFGLFLDDHLRKYIVERLSVTACSGPRSIKPEMFIWSEFPLSLLTIELMRLISLNNTEELAVEAFELTNDGHSFVKYEESLKIRFYNRDEFIDSLIPRGSDNKENAELEAERLDELLFATYHHLERIEAITSSLESGDAQKRRIALEMLIDRSIIGIHVDSIELLEYTADMRDSRILPSNIAMLLLRSQYFALGLHAQSQFISIADKFNRISLCFLSYFREGTKICENILSQAEKRLIGVVERKIRSRDKGRYSIEIFLLSELNGGLGLFNFIPGFPIFSDYVLDQNDVPALDAPEKELQEHFYCYLPLLENSLKQSQYAAIDVYFDDIFKTINTPKFIERTSLLRLSQEDYENYFEFKKNFISAEPSREFSNTTKAQRRGSEIIANRRFIAFWSPMLNRTDIFIGKEHRIAQTGISVRGKLISLCQFYQQLFKLNLWGKIHQNAVSFVRNVLQQADGVSSVEVMEAHEDKICGIINAPSNKNGICADFLCTTINEQQFGNMFVVDLQLIFPSADEFSEGNLLQLERRLTRHHCYPSISIFIDLVYCRIRATGEPELAYLQKMIVQRLEKQIGHFPSIRLLRRRARELLEVHSEVAEEELFMTLENAPDLLKNGSFYVDTIHTPEGIVLIAVQFFSGIVDFICQKTEVEAARSAIEVINDVETESLKIISEDSQIKLKLEDSAALHSDKDVDCVQSMLQLNIKMLGQCVALPQGSGAKLRYKLYSQDVKEFGSLATEFWRTLTILRCLTISKEATVRVIGTCAELRKIDYFTDFPTSKGNIKLADADYQMQGLLLQQLGCERKNLRVVLLGGTPEITRHAVFRKGENVIIAEVKTEEHEKSEPMERELSLSAPERCGDLVTVIPNDLREYWDLEGLGFHMCGIVIEKARELRCLIRDFSGGFELEDFGVFGCEMKINDGGEVQSDFPIIVTERLGLGVFVHRGLELVAWDPFMIFTQE